MSDIADSPGRTHDGQIAPPATQRRLNPGAEGKACLWPTRSRPPSDEARTTSPSSATGSAAGGCTAPPPFVIAIETWVIVNALLDRPIVPAMPTIDPLILVPVLFFACAAAPARRDAAGLGALPARRLPARAGGRPAGRRHRHRPRQGGRAPLASTCSRRTSSSPSRWAAPRAAACCSRGCPGTGKTMTGQGHGGRGRGAVPVRLGDVVPVDVLRRDRQEDPRRTSRRCARRPAPRAARSASSRRSTPSRSRRGGMASADGGVEPVRRVPGPAHGHQRGGQRGDRRRRERAAGADAVVRPADDGRQVRQLVHRARQPAAAGVAASSSSASRSRRRSC